MRHDKAIEYLRHAMHFAGRFSKDRSTKVGAFFLHPTYHSILTRGYNGLPRGCHDDLAERHERPLKYEYFEHAERNAIFNVVRRDLRNSVVVTTETLTMSSARALIAVGATEVWSPRPRLPTDQHARAIALLREVGVASGYHDGTSMQAPQSRYIQKLEDYLDDAKAMVRFHAKDPRASGTLFLAPNGDFTELASGYSGMPRGADDSRMERYEGSERVYWVEDSVRNAIYNKARPLLEGSVAAVTQEPCAECFRAVAAVGSKKAIAPRPSPEFAARWAEQFARTREMAEELKVELISVPPEELVETILAAAA